MHRLYFIFSLVIFISCERTNENSDLPPEQKGRVQLTHKDSLNIETEFSENRTTNEKVKIYLENTLSMYGYIPKKSIHSTDFRNTINELLIASKNSYYNPNVELFLLNNRASVPVDLNNNLDNIDESTLRSQYSKGNTSSDFDKLFEKILVDLKQDEVVVFIADFIYSPPPNETEVISGLEGLRQNITAAFLNSKGSESLAVNVLHLESDFHGPYYDNDNDSVPGIKSRPYYIFIIGNQKSVKKYSTDVVPKLQRYNLKNQYNITPSSTVIKNYSALPFTLNIGQFESNSSSRATSQIKNIKVKTSLSQNTRLQLAISADLRDIPISDEYKMKTDNYLLNDDRLKLLDIGLIKNNKIHLADGSEHVIKSNDIANAKNTTHAFIITFPSAYKGVIELSLKKNIPKWVEQVSVKDGEDDRDIKTNALKQSQTFGFKHIVEGVYNAQVKDNSENEYFRILLDVNQEKSGSGLGSIIGWLIAFIIIGIIIFIIMRNKQRK